MKGYGSLHFFYKECAMHASGKLLLLWNDDARMMTQDWDRKLWQATATRREQGLHGFWTLSNNHWPYAFPVITRSVTERLGAFARFSYNDAYIFELAKACAIEQPILDNIQVLHEMLEESDWDGESLRLYNAGFFQDIINADADLLMQVHPNRSKPR